MFGFAENLKKLLSNNMKQWWSELTAGREVIGNVKLSRGIFQGDSLSPFVFMIALIPMTLVLRKVKSCYQLSKNGDKLNHLMYMDDTKLYAKDEESLKGLIQAVRVVSNDIGMEFGVEKCTILVPKRDKIVESNGILLPNNDIIKSIHGENGYKYLGVLESDGVLCEQMKEKLKQGYKRRIKKSLRSKLSGGNIITAVNTWAVSLIRYAAPFVEWRRDELKEMDRSTRKVMNMYRALHPRDSVARLYLPRKEGGRGLLSIEDSFGLAKLGLENYVQQSDESLLASVRAAVEVPETVKEFKNEGKRREEQS